MTDTEALAEIKRILDALRMEGIDYGEITIIAKKGVIRWVDYSGMFPNITGENSRK